MADPAKLIGGNLQTERLSDGKRTLLRGLKMQVEDEKLTVPTGTVTDYSSIPWIGRGLVHWSKVDIAGVVHDWLYQTGIVDRKRADEIWYLIAISGEHSANKFQAYVAWKGLRAGGWAVWNRYRKGEK